jgi:hypothetical protein
MFKLLHEKKMNIDYGITKIDVDMTLCAKTLVMVIQKIVRKSMITLRF